MRAILLSPLLAKVTFYTKPNCPLCEKALEQIELARQHIPFDLALVNILSDPEVYDRYKQDIPVVHLNGVEIFRHHVSAGELVVKLRALGSGG